ncbi:MAG: hypothetical protein CBC38_03560 [Gammaproteobacteria bacterium TMED78]|nr:MAG: hypothetical protein CBC38_03560 [Gammaproteobacteria bacterium TMED78]|tara:strand:+ start:589 stop:1437 length:849 start_codon:yes stop_codon:yes gene_type:complete
MKILSFKKNNKNSFGVLNDNGIVDAGPKLNKKYPNLKSILESNKIDLLKKIENDPIDYRIDDVDFLPPIPNAEKIICVGINYLGHIKETGREIPKYPVLFSRFIDSFVGHNEPLVRPRVSSDFDYEGELAVIIGKRAWHVNEASAMEYVAGYSCCNEGSIRDYQFHTIQWMPGKNFFKSGSIGPYITTTEEQNDPSNFYLQTKLNGNILQNAPVSDLCFSIPQLISYCSEWTPLNPGDILITGTPGGVGRVRKPPIWMKPNDEVEVNISGVGILKNTIIDEK